jgi:NitT/TauT family transport system substrate-binding protein
VSSSAPRLSRRRWLMGAAAAAGALAVAGRASTTLAAGLGEIAGQSSARAVTTSPVYQSAGQGSMVTNWFGQSSQGGFFAAAMNGRYQEQGLDMTVDQGGPQVAGVPLVAAGKYTFAMTSTDQVLLARAEGAPLVMVFGTFQRNPQGLMFHASNPVSDFPELNGRKVFVSGAGTFWQYLKAKYNLNEVEQMQYNGQNALFLADEASVSQCFVTSEPVILKIQGYDIGALVNADSGFNPYQNAMVCTEQTIKDHPDLVQAYVTASLAGWMDYMSDPQPTLQFIKDNYAKELNLDTEPLTFASEKAGFITGANGYDPAQLGLITDDRFKDVYEQIRGINMLKQDLDYKGGFDASFIMKAHETLGM